MTTYLDKILESHRQAASDDSRSTDRLIEQARDVEGPRSFVDALRDNSELSVIAEIKRRSPSKGDLALDLDPARLASVYEAGGARCLSVLTDRDYFGGSRDDLATARAAVSLPVLRKDFTVSVNDVCDTRLMGADCVLLIVAALDDRELRDFAVLAVELGLDILIEVHDETELDRAMNQTSGDLIGVNQRDLVTFDVDQDRAVRVAALMEPTTVRVAESGVRGAADAVTLAEAGYHAVLVGEHLVTSPDPKAELKELRVERS